MKKQNGQTAKTHHSAVLEDFLSLGSPEELARTENRMLLAVKIQDGMTAKGIGKKQFADMMGQSPSVITKWLSGGQNFTVDTLTDIERALDIRLLALEEKPILQVVYKTSMSLVIPLNKSHELDQATGQSSALLSLSAGIEKAHASKEHLKRFSAYA